MNWIMWLVTLNTLLKFIWNHSWKRFRNLQEKDNFVELDWYLHQKSLSFWKLHNLELTLKIAKLHLKLVSQLTGSEQGKWLDLNFKPKQSSKIVLKLFSERSFKARENKAFVQTKTNIDVEYIILRSFEGCLQSTIKAMT